MEKAMNSSAIALMSPLWRHRRLCPFNLIVPYFHMPGFPWSLEELGLFQFYCNSITAFWSKAGPLHSSSCSPLVAVLVGAAVFAATSPSNINSILFVLFIFILQCVEFLMCFFNPNFQL